MRLNWKVLWMVCIPSLIFVGTGCSGINATQSVSPATFLLPGLLQADPPALHPERTLPAPEHGEMVARF